GLKPLKIKGLATNSGRFCLKKRMPNYPNPNEPETPDHALQRTRPSRQRLQSNVLVCRVAELGSLYRSNPMTFSFGQSEHERIEVDVLRYERSPVGEYHDDNWLTSQVSVC